MENEKKTSAYAIMRESRKNQIIDAAKHMILADGIEALNMQKLANALGISRVTLYKYYKSIEEIVVEIEKDVIENTLLSCFESFESPADSADLNAMLAHFVKTAFENRADFIFNNIFDIYVTNKTDSPLINDVFEQYVKATDPFPEYIKRMQKKGLVRNDLDGEHLAFCINYILIGSLERMIVLEKNRKRYVPHTEQEYENALLEMIGAYIKPR